MMCSDQGREMLWKITFEKIWKPERKKRPMPQQTEDLVKIHQTVTRPRPTLAEVWQLAEHLSDADLDNLKYAIFVEEAKRKFPDALPVHAIELHRESGQRPVYTS
jgi:hypothetical protein